MKTGFLPVAKAVCITAILSSSALQGGELFFDGNPRDGSPKDDQGNELERSTLEGEEVFVLRNKRIWLLEPMIEVDLAKSYHLLAEMRSAEGLPPASANFGVYMYDARKRLISIRHVGVKEGTLTTLVKPVEAGSREVWLESGWHWVKPAHYHALAFGAKEDFSDLPNFTVSPQVEKAEKTPEGWKVTLKEPMTKSFPAGTTVRQHQAWEPGLHRVAQGWVPTAWTKYETVLHGEAPFGTPKDRFWKGTRYVKVMVRRWNWNRIPEKEAILYIRKISLREVPTVSEPTP
ncbi:MAG TPA: hypothetical protein VNQ90_15985 [Chthoniobacteraceae bacterium]|nr:hypothetical protein [Chthoniobacteraceae bacterium]